MTTVALCIICHERPAELDDALASAAGEGWDEVVVLDMASDPPLPARSGVTWVRSEVNVGVAAGRNRLLARTEAEVVVFLDDDAVFLTPVVEPLRAWFSDPRLAVLAMAVRRSDGTTVSSEYPFRGPARADRQPRPCAYFVGAAFAGRRASLLEVGGQDEGFFYSTEEVDLGFRLLGAGWRLVFDPRLVVEHRPSPRGREVAPRVAALRLRNRLVTVRRHLPGPVAVVHGLVWGARTFLEARAAGALRPWLQAWPEGCESRWGVLRSHGRPRRVGRPDAGV
jgi:GT2 family glycosyltransferase